MIAAFKFPEKYRYKNVVILSFALIFYLTFSTTGNTFLLYLILYNKYMQQ